MECDAATQRKPFHMDLIDHIYLSRDFIEILRVNYVTILDVFILKSSTHSVARWSRKCGETYCRSNYTRLKSNKIWAAISSIGISRPNRDRFAVVTLWLRHGKQQIHRKGCQNIYSESFLFFFLLKFSRTSLEFSVSLCVDTIKAVCVHECKTISYHCRWNCCESDPHRQKEE